MPLAYIHPRGLPSRAINFDLWQNYAPKFSPVTANSLTPGRFTEITQSIGKKAPTFKFTAMFDEWAVSRQLAAVLSPFAPVMAGQFPSGAHAAWLFIHEWFGDDGPDVENVFVLKIIDRAREVIFDDVAPVADSIQASEDGRMLRFKCEFSGRFFTDASVDPGLFNKPKRRRSGRGSPTPWESANPGANNSVFAGPIVNFDGPTQGWPTRGSDTDSADMEEYKSRSVLRRIISARGPRGGGM